MPYSKTEKKAAKAKRNVSLSIWGIYDKLVLFVNRTLTSYSSAVKAVSIYSFNHNENLSLPHNGTEWRRSQS